MFDFGRLPKAHRDDARWILFILIYFTRSDDTSSLSVASLRNYWNLITSVSRFAKSRGLGLVDVIKSDLSLAEYASTLSVELTVGTLHALVKYLLQVGYETTGIRVAGSQIIRSLAQLKSQLDFKKQHPVVPPRILTALFSELSLLLDEVCAVEEGLCEFIRKCSADRSYGRGLKNPPANRNDTRRELRISFLVGASNHGLLDLFGKYGVKSTLDLSGFIARIQHGCKFLVHIYSGMRDGEAHSLKVDCLRKIRQKDGTVLRLVGTTTKLAGTAMKTAWVTSPEIERPIHVLRQLAKIVTDRTCADPKETPLFVSMAYLGLTRGDIWERGLRPGETCKSAHFGVTPREVVNILDTSEFRISSNDLRFLESVDAHRAWHDEPKFKKGCVWRFTTHQFRRHSHTTLPKAGWSLYQH